MPKIWTYEDKECDYRITLLEKLEKVSLEWQLKPGVGNQTDYPRADGETLSIQDFIKKIEANTLREYPKRFLNRVRKALSSSSK